MIRYQMSGARHGEIFIGEYSELKHFLKKIRQRPLDFVSQRFSLPVRKYFPEGLLLFRRDLKPIPFPSGKGIHGP